MTRDEALAAFRASREGAKGVNPYTVFLQGWDAREAALQEEQAPRAHPRFREVRSSGWSGAEQEVNR